jgi:hypothetical protein
MKKIFFAITATLLASGANACMLKGEQTSGMNKICYYSCVSGTRAITISAVALCPLTLSAAPLLKDIVTAKTDNNIKTFTSSSAKFGNS